MSDWRIRAIILDFDGVVVESNSVKTDAFADVFARFPEHAEAMMAFHRANVSASRFVKFDHLIDELLGRRGDAALRESLARDFSRRTRERIVGVPFVAGAKEFLDAFAGRVPLYLASVTPEEDLATILQRRDLARFFESVYGCPPWTKPDAIRDMLSRRALSAEEAVLVGDSSGDIRAAAETGVRFIGRDSGLPLDPRPAVIRPDLFGIADFLRPLIA